MDWLINVLQSWIKDVTDEFDTLLNLHIASSIIYTSSYWSLTRDRVCLDSRLFMRVLNPMVFLL